MELVLIYMKCLMIVLIVREKTTLWSNLENEKVKSFLKVMSKIFVTKYKKLTEGINQATAAN